MTTYNTGNLIGSTDPRDLFDNAENLDTAMQTSSPTFVDRLGVTRTSWEGAIKYTVLSETYSAGIEVTTRNQIILSAGEWWAISAATSLPYTTTGAGMPEGGAFQSVGDAKLRSDLVQVVPTFNNVADMKSSSAITVGQKVRTLGYYTPGDGGGNDYEIVAAATGTDDGGSYIDLTGISGQAKGLFVDAEISAQRFGAKGDGVSDDTLSWEACRDYCLLAAADRVFIAKGGQHYIPSGVSLYGLFYVRVDGNIKTDLNTDEVIIGGNVVQANPSKWMFHSGNCVLKVDGLSRGHVEFTRFQGLTLFASNSGENTKYNVSYCNFYFTEVVDFKMETNTVSGTTAWMNENKFYGGRITNSLTMTGDYPMNNNSFYGFKLESISITIDAYNGSLGAHSNHFHDCRLEGVMNFTFGVGTFNNIFWQTWSNFANTMIWDLPAATYNITNDGDNNRIVPVHYNYINKKVNTLYDVNNLGNNGVFEVSATNPEKIKVVQNAGVVFDSGLLPVTDKSWFTLTGDVASFHLYLEVYDDNLNPITTEPTSGFKTSQGSTVWNAAGYWWYNSPVTGGNFAVNPNKDVTVKFIRYWARVDNGASGDEHDAINAWVAFPQDSEYEVRNKAQDSLKVDFMSNKVTATSEATAVDIVKFTAGAGVTDAAGVLSAQAIFSLTTQKGSAEAAATAHCFINVAKEDTGVISITSSSPTILSNGGSLDFTGITLSTKAGASATEAIMQITMQTNQADPFDSLNARVRLVGIRDHNKSINHIIDVKRV